MDSRNDLERITQGRKKVGRYREVDPNGGCAVRRRGLFFDGRFFGTERNVLLTKKPEFVMIY